MVKVFQANVPESNNIILFRTELGYQTLLDTIHISSNPEDLKHTTIQVIYYAKRGILKKNVCFGSVLFGVNEGDSERSEVNQWKNVFNQPGKMFSQNYRLID